MAIAQTLSEPVVKDNKDLTWLTKGTLAALAVGALGLYLMIPERKRKNLF